MTTPWTDGIRVIRDGEPVNAAVTNRPLADLLARDEHLKDLIDALHLGEALYLRERAVAPECSEGDAVYYDADAGAFAPALAAGGVVGSTVEVYPSAHVAGVVARKHSATVADLVVAGAVSLDPGVIDDSSASGPRYLSASASGRLTAVRPALGVLVGQWLAEYRTLLVQPAPRTSLDGHTHYRFRLYAAPAGVANTPAFMDRHAVAAADPSLPGWLPADHALFGGAAPAGAKFGYNLSRHPELFKVFPPAPLESAYVEAYYDGAGYGVELGRVVRVTASGIWWLRDDWGWAPWQLDLANLDTDPGHVVTPPETPPPVVLQHGHGYVSDSDPHDCPFSLYLWFSRPAYYGDNAVVASLTAKEGSPVAITDCTGKAASTGHLVVGVDFGLTDAGDYHAGYVVVKDFDGAAMKRGPVLAGIKSNSQIITIVSAEGLSPDSDGYYPGRVALEYHDPNTMARELDVSLFALDGATEEKYADMFYLGFTPGRRSAVRGRIDIPESGMPAGPFSVTLRLRMLGTTAGSWPALQMTYRRLAAAPAPMALPENTSEITLADIEPIQSLPAANFYFDCATAPMAARAGDTLLFTLRRNVDAYAGIVGVIRARGVIAS